MVKQTVAKKKSTTTKSTAAKKPAAKTKSTAVKKKTSSKPSEPFRPMMMTVAISSLAAVTLFTFAMISIL